MIEALPPGGEVMIYGGLSEEPAAIHPGKMIFEKKKVSGFWLSDWITHQPTLKLLRTFNKIQKVISHGHHTKVHKKVALKDAQSGINDYLKNMTAGKVLVQPGLKS